MPEGELTFHVARSAEEVFDYLADLERAPEWAPGLSDVEKRTTGEIRLGTRFVGTVSLAGRTEAGELEIVEFRRPDLFEYAGEGRSARFTARFELATADTGTRVVHRYALELSGFAKMMAPMLGGVLAEHARAGIEALRRTIEAEPPRG